MIDEGNELDAEFLQRAVTHAFLDGISRQFDILAILYCCLHNMMALCAFLVIILCSHRSI